MLQTDFDHIKKVNKELKRDKQISAQELAVQNAKAN